MPNEMCRTPSGRESSRPHSSRLRPGREDLTTEQVWDELQRRGATIASVPFSGRAGAGGRTATITLSRLEHDQLITVERWGGGRDELAYALEAPIFDRFGGFAGQPFTRGTLTWSLAERRVVIEGTRGDRPFQEAVR